MAGLGVRAGVADICVLHDGRFYALELKAAGGRSTEAQIEFRDEVMRPVDLPRRRLGSTPRSAFGAVGLGQGSNLLDCGGSHLGKLGVQLHGEVSAL